MTDTYLQTNCERTRYEDWNCAQLFLTARDFLRQNAKRKKFFLWLDCFDPHEPWDVPPEFVLKYDQTPGYDGRVDPRTFGSWASSELTEAAVRRIRNYYAAKVTWVDHWLGHLLDALEETGLSRNTAILLTSDHGTNDGTVNGFGKKVPPREAEAHTPFMVSVPGMGSGTCDSFVQPQDAFGTILSVAGANPPACLDTHDILTLAREGRTGPREIAIAGLPPEERKTLFTAFDGTWCLEVAARPDDCVLIRMGETRDAAAENPDVVKELRTKALDEYERRGADPAVVGWLRSEGKTSFPSHFTPHKFYPVPAGFQHYFKRLYHGDFAEE